MGKAKQKNNVLRVEIDNAEIARRLGVTPHYVRYLLRGKRFNIQMLKQIRQIVMSERERFSETAFAQVTGRLDRLITEAEKKSGE